MLCNNRVRFFIYFLINKCEKVSLKEKKTKLNDNIYIYIIF